MMRIKGLITITGFVLAFVMFGLFVVANRNNATAGEKPTPPKRTFTEEVIMELLSFGETYVRKAVVIRWIDGDTVDLHIDLGYRVYLAERVRLSGVDTPERGHPDFDKATAMARKYAPEASICMIRSEPAGRDKYGRWLGTIYVGGMGRTLNETLIQAGWPYKR